MDHEKFPMSGESEPERSLLQRLGNAGKNNTEIDYMSERTAEQRNKAKQILSQIQSHILDGNKESLTDAEASALSVNTDIYDYYAYPEIKALFSNYLISTIESAAEKDFTNYPERDELFLAAKIIGESQTAVDLITESLNNGTDLNQQGIQNIGNAILKNYSESDSAVVEKLMRMEQVGYEPFSKFGAEEILFRGQDFQEALLAERGIGPDEVDALYESLRFYLKYQGFITVGDTISDLLTPSENNNFATLWQKDGEVLIDILNRIPIDIRSAVFDNSGNLTDTFSQSLINNFSVTNVDENKFIANHPELFSNEELRESLFKQIFNPSDEYKRETMGDFRDAALLGFLKLAGSDIYDENLATSWFVSFVSEHAFSNEGFFHFGSPEEISAVAEIAPMLVNNYDGMTSYRLADEKNKSWSKADFGLIENCIVLWQLEHPEERGLLNRFLNANTAEYINYSEEFPNFAKQVRRLILERESPDETNPTKDEIVNLLTNTIRNRDFYAEEYSNFIIPPDAGRAYYWKKFVNNYDDYYKRFTPEAIKQIPAVMTLLCTTSVEELAKNRGIIADQILTHSPENAEQIVRNLESVFLRKDIPKFAKLYYFADLLYVDTIDEQADIPYFLKWAEVDSRGFYSARDVLMTDLLKNSIRSNNSSLREYLKFCIASRDDSDMLNGTAEIRNSHSDTVFLEDFVDNKKFRRRFFGYASNLGFNNPEQILEAMDKLRDEKNAQHKGSVWYDEQGKARYRNNFKAGDLIKGIYADYLHLAIQDGFNCPEMAGIGVDRDFTHWDADFGSVRKEDEGATVNEMIAGSMAAPYGDGLYAIVHRDGLKAFDSSYDEVGDYKISDYEIYHRYQDNFRGIRTGIGSEDIDAYVVDSNNNSRRRGLRLMYEMAKNGIYAPIIDRETEEVIFTPDDFEKLRSRMGGLNSRYATLPSECFIASDLSLPDGLMSKNGLKYSDLASSYFDRVLEGVNLNTGVRGQICSRFFFDKSIPKEIRDSFHKALLHTLSGDHSDDSIEIIATGSTSRGTNIPSNADVDVVMRLDRFVFDNYKSEILDALTTRHEMYYNGEKPVVNGGTLTDKGIRKGVVEALAGGEAFTHIEVDISPVVTTNQRNFFSDKAAEERLNSNRLGNTNQVAANIVMAKALLKDAQAYETDRSPKHEGGLGGLGVENWILQSGGSLRQACEEFLAVADDRKGGYIPFDDFSSRYAVFDMGENRFGNNSESPYDNFIERNMNKDGYLKMCDTCKRILQHIYGSRSRES